MKKLLSLLLLLALALSVTGCGGKSHTAVTPAPTADMGQSYIDRFVFLGDSTTYGLAYYEVLPHSQVWTPASGTLTLNNWAVEAVEYYDEQDEVQSLSIADAAALRQPEYMMITLGLNGISYLNEDDFKSYYISLVQAIQATSPNTKIICNSIYPVIDAEVSSDIGNDRINAANIWIEAVATETGTRYLNTHDDLMDESGNLRTEYCNGDGIHLSPDGFNVMLQNVRTHGYQ